MGHDHSMAKDKNNKSLSASHWDPSISNLKKFSRILRDNFLLRKDAKFGTLFHILSLEMLGHSSKFNDIYCLFDEGFWQNFHHP